MAIDINNWKTRLMSNNSVKISQLDFFNNIESIRDSYKKLPKEILPEVYVGNLNTDTLKFAELYLSNAFGNKVKCTVSDNLVIIEKL